TTGVTPSSRLVGARGSVPDLIARGVVDRSLLTAWTRRSQLAERLVTAEGCPRRGRIPAHIRVMITPMLTAYPAPGAPGTVIKPVWIDLLEPTPEERDRIASEYGLRVPAREALEEIESSSRLQAEGQVLTLSMPLTVPEERADPLPAPLGFILSPSLLVSVRFTEVHGFAETRARLDKVDV